MRRMIFSILFLFLANMAVADCCGTTSNADKNKWQNSGKELVVINGKIFELNVKKITSDADELVVTYTKFNEDNSIFIDSVIYSDGTTSILETDFFSAEGISTSRMKIESVILAKRIQGCSGLREDPTMPNAQCIRYERSEISDAKSENIYFPGIGVNATFGFSYGRFNEN